MDSKEVISRMQSLADPRAISVWARVCVTPERFLGVNLTKLKALAKEVKKNHELALELWDTKIHDAKLLATMIEEPKKVTLEQIDRQTKEIYSFDLGDKYCSNVVAKTRFIQRKIDEWTQSEEEFVKRRGYMLVCAQANNDESLPDEYFEEFLSIIEEELQRQKNWAKEAMNYALIAIGSRNRFLNQKAIEAARRIGKVEIDYGRTSCHTIDALGKLTESKYLKNMGGK